MIQLCMARAMVETACAVFQTLHEGILQEPNLPFCNDVEWLFGHTEFCISVVLSGYS